MQKLQQPNVVRRCEGRDKPFSRKLPSDTPPAFIIDKMRREEAEKRRQEDARRPVLKIEIDRREMPPRRQDREDHDERDHEREEGEEGPIVITLC